MARLPEGALMQRAAAGLAVACGDLLRRNGWKGHGPVPWEHEPNRGFLRCLAALGKAAALIDEKDEAERCATFLRDSSPTAADVLS